MIWMFTTDTRLQLQIIQTAFITITLHQTIHTLMAMAIMEHLARFHNKIILVIMICVGCKQATNDDGIIPNVFINVNDGALKQREGFLYYRDKKFSGRTVELYPNGDTALLFSYDDGKEEGWSRKWYPGKKLMEERFYSHGKKEGVHRNWWPDGKPKFEYHFLNDGHNGEAKEWYSNGKIYRLFHYTNGYEDGLQQMWWEDGRVRANYVEKDGEQYGLIGRKLCKNNLNEQ